MLSSGGGHSGLGNGNIFISGEVLELLLFMSVDGQWKIFIDGLVESGNVSVNVVLANIALSV